MIIKMNGFIIETDEIQYIYPIEEVLSHGVLENCKMILKLKGENSNLLYTYFYRGLINKNYSSQEKDKILREVSNQFLNDLSRYMLVSKEYSSENPQLIIRELNIVYPEHKGSTQVPKILSEIKD